MITTGKFVIRVLPRKMFLAGFEVNANAFS